MYRAIFDDMTQCTEADVNRLLPLVSSQRRTEALRYKHVFGQWACLKTFELWQILMSSHYHQKATEWLYNEYGKPYLADGPYFSISHCKNAVAVAMDDFPIGMDIESIRSVDDALIERVMNPEERSQISNSVSKEETFTQLWTQKEAVLKLRGTGIIDNLQDVLLPSAITDIHLQTHINHEHGYVFTIAETKIR